jgi:RNA polymerase sigma factor (sigma-70 family)
LPPIEISPKPKKPSRRKRDALVAQHLDWAHGIARHVARLLPTWFTVDDLVGPVEIALVKVAAEYDPSRNDSFRAFAYRRIYGSCFDSVRRKEYLERSHFSLGSQPQLNKSANRAGKDRELQIPDKGPTPEEAAAAAQQSRVWAIVQQLPSRHALVILAVYGGGMSLEDLATKVDVGSSRLSQIHHEALRMLRTCCEDLAA